MFGDPDHGAIFAVNFGFKITNDAVGLHDVDELGAALRLNVELLLNVADAELEFLWGIVSVEAGEGGIDGDVFTGGGGLEDAFDGVFEDSAEAAFVGFQGFDEMVMEFGLLGKVVVEGGEEREDFNESKLSGGELDNEGLDLERGGARESFGDGLFKRGIRRKNEAGEVAVRKEIGSKRACGVVSEELIKAGTGQDAEGLGILENENGGERGGAFEKMRDGGEVGRAGERVVKEREVC
jgi:hypothetical protein